MVKVTQSVCLSQSYCLEKVGANRQSLVSVQFYMFIMYPIINYSYTIPLAMSW